jgi:hypothetical protein
LTLARDRSGHSVSSHFNPDTHYIVGWVIPRASLEASEVKNLAFMGFKYQPLSLQTVILPNINYNFGVEKKFSDKIAL